MKTRSIAAAAVAILAVVAIVLTVVGYYGTQRFRAPVPTNNRHGLVRAHPDVQGGDPPRRTTNQAHHVGQCARKAPSTASEGVNSSDPSEYQCAFLKAPLDWDEPRRRPDHPRPRHPPLRGREMHPPSSSTPAAPAAPSSPRCPTTAAQGLGESVVKAYDIVALDPRGVGDSTPVFCMTDAGKGRT